MLSSVELAQIRADVADLLPDTCNILSVSRTSDNQGGYTETWGTSTAGVSCRIDAVKATSGNQLSGDSLRSFKEFILTLPYSTTISEVNRVELNSETFAVTSVDDGKSWAVVKRAYVERI